MEVASGLAGLISLSITVCSGLTQYYQSWSSQDTTIQDALRNLADLQNTLELVDGSLGELIAEQTDTTKVNHVKVLHGNLEVGSQRLKAILIDCQANKPLKDVKERGKVILKRAIYPFKTQTIQELQKTVQDMRANLSLGLEVLQLNISSNLSNNLTKIETSLQAGLVKTLDIGSITNNIDTTTASIHGKVEEIISTLSHSDLKTELSTISAQSLKAEDVVDSIATTSAATYHRIEEMTSQLQNLKSADTAASVSFIHEQMPLISATVSRVDARSASHSEGVEFLTQVIEQRFAVAEQHFAHMFQLLKANTSLPGGTINEANRLASRIVEKPSLHQELCNFTFNKLSSTKICSCTRRSRRKYKQLQSPLIGFFYRKQLSSNHSESCPFFTKHDIESSYGMILGSWRTFLGRTIELAFHKQVGACGGFAGMRVNIRSIYRPDSPAFALLHKLSFGNPIPACPKDTLHKLQHLYRSGQASPYDVDGYGCNVLFKLVEQIVVYAKPSTAMAWIQYGFRELIEAGGSQQESGYDGATPLGVLVGLMDPIHSDIVKFAIQIALSLDVCYLELGPFMYRNRRAGANLIKILPYLITEYEVVQIGPLCRAVLARSQENVRHELLHSPNALYEERSTYGFSALHLAADWPKGLSLLLCAGGATLMDQPDMFGARPFDYAAIYSNADSMALLVNSGCVYFDEKNLKIFSPFGPFRPLSRGDPPLPLPSDVMIIEVKAIKAKRQAISDFAATKIAPAASRIPTYDVLDGTSYRQTVAILEEMEITMPSYIYSSTFSVYWMDMLPIEVAQILWDEGFHDIDYEVDGLSLLGFHCMERNVPLVEWLIGKGARFQIASNLSVQGKCSYSITMSHYVAFALSPRFFWRDYVDLSHLRNLQHELDGETTDFCSCPCSPNGCIPLSIFLRESEEHFLSHIRPSFVSLRKLSLLRTYVLEDIHELLQKYSKHLIRIATMNAFEISHTCCKRTYWETTTGSGSHGWANSLAPRFGRIETNEIQVEERLLISEFTSVVNELESLYQQQDIPLPAFIHTVWKDKMLELMEGDVEPSETDMQQLAAVGVKLQIHKVLTSTRNMMTNMMVNMTMSAILKVHTGTVPRLTDLLTFGWLYSIHLSSPLKSLAVLRNNLVQSILQARCFS